MQEREWLEGYRLVLAVDAVLVYAAGHKAFEISFSLSEATTMELVKQAKMLVPNDPGSVEGLRQYKERRAAAAGRPAGGSSLQ